MSRLPMYGKRPCVLLTNDDGPPSAFSPNIYGFARLLQDKLGWDIKVVVPDCQKSWVGKAYAISDVISASYFYPRGPDGMTGDITPVSRPLKDDETMEWVLLSGTPATCANIGLHNLYPGQIDLVISGPNHGRNSSTAFALSSGTIGAALGAALAVPIPGPTSGPSLHADHIPAIALSYGVIKRPVPAIVSQLAHEASAEVCARLWDDWGYEDGTGKRIQLYTINVPLEEEPLRPENRKVYWTRLWRNAYGALFQATKAETTSHDPSDNTTQNNSTAGQSTATVAGPGAVPTTESPDTSKHDDAESRRLRFKFAPTMGHLLTPRPEDVPEGTDAWGFARGYITVTPLKAEFASIADSARAFGSDEEGVGPCAGRMWKSQSRL